MKRRKCSIVLRLFRKLKRIIFLHNKLQKYFDTYYIMF